MLYLFDTNCFIQPYNQYYPFDLVPGYWEFIEICAQEDRLFVIEEVCHEIKDNGDDLSVWFNNSLKFIKQLPMSEATLACLTEINNWVNTSKYSVAKKNDFQRGADQYLIAHAKANNGTVVTCEKPHVPGMTKKIRIPDLCDQLGVHWISLYDYLRQQRMKLSRME